MDTISEKQVIQHWIRSNAQEEREKGNSSIKSRDELLDDLQKQQGGPTTIFDKHNIQWYKRELTEEEFRELRIVKGPPDKDWRLFTEDSSSTPSAELIAKEISSIDNASTLDSRLQEKIDKVRNIRTSIKNGGQIEPLIILEENNRDLPWIADGNHRAVAILLHLMETGEYKSPLVFYGIETKGFFGTKISDFIRPFIPLFCP